MADANTGLKNGRGPSGADRDDDFEIEIRIEKPVIDPIDRAGNMFDREARRYSGGINTAQSVFSGQTLFNATPENAGLDTRKKQATPKEPYGTHSDS